MPILGTTENYNLNKYESGSDDWGPGMNNNMDVIDNEIKNGRHANNIQYDATTTVKEKIDGMATSGFETGFILPFPKRVAPNGFIMATEGYSIGNTLSGADYEGNDYKNLYALLWENAEISDNMAIISSVKGVSWNADWDIGKTITIDLANYFLRPAKCDVNNIGEKIQDAFQAWQLGSTEDLSGVVNYYGHIAQRDYEDDVHPGGSGWSYSRYHQLGQGDSKMLKAMNDGTHGEPRTDDETRPKNVTMPYIIKL